MQSSDKTGDFERPEAKFGQKKSFLVDTGSDKTEGKIGTFVSGLYRD